MALNERNFMIWQALGRAMKRIMSIRRLLAMLVTLAVLFAPAAATSASAAEPHHEMQMMHVGHCRGPMPNSTKHDKTAGMTCCMTICMAVAESAVATQPETPVQISPPVFSSPASLTGQPTELPTPPPRLS